MSASKGRNYFHMTTLTSPTAASALCLSPALPCSTRPRVAHRVQHLALVPTRRLLKRQLLSEAVSGEM